MHRCYPKSVFNHAATCNGWRLRDSGVTNIWITVVAPIGRLVVTRHCNGRLQVQGVALNSPNHHQAEKVIHGQMQDARAALIGERAVMSSISIEQATREFEEEWQAEKHGRSPRTPLPFE